MFQLPFSNASVVEAGKKNVLDTQTPFRGQEGVGETSGRFGTTAPTVGQLPERRHEGSQQRAQGN